MRAEKTSILKEITTQVNSSPYVILTDFTGMTVDGFSELRGRLTKAKARALVVKNSFMRHTLKDLNLPEMDEALKGPTAIVFGENDVAMAASVIKTFIKDFKKLKVKGGILDKAVLTATEVNTIADLPPRPVLQAQLLGLLMNPSTTLVRLLNTPASQLVQVLKAKSEKTA
jgi:large subunit ribosomal protein L10